MPHSKKPSFLKGGRHHGKKDKTPDLSKAPIEHDEPGPHTRAADLIILHNRLELELLEEERAALLRLRTEGAT